MTPDGPRADRWTDPDTSLAGPSGWLGRLRLWLAPGMGVKRHVAVAVVGALATGTGLVLGVLWLAADLRAEVAAPIEEVLVSDAWRAVGGVVALVVTVLGASVAVSAIGRLNRSLLSNWLSRPNDAAMVLHRRLRLSRGPRIVAFGGGTGLANLMRGLRVGTSNLTAVVTVADDGGSSGRLRTAFGMPAPGDLSDCLAALSDHEVEVGRLMEYRFVRGAELQGHTFGNLLITTLSEVEGDLGQATRVLNRMLHLSGAVWPVTSAPVTLAARKEDAERIVGESRLREAPGAIRRLEIDPPDPEAFPEVLAAVHDADLIVLGPGSLFTSVVAPLLVPDVRAALIASDAPVVFVCNIMTEAGESDGMDAFDHVQAIRDHIGRWPDLVLVNEGEVDSERRRAYEAEGAEEVEVSSAAFARAGVALRSAPLVGSGPHAQHDPGRLATVIADLAWRVRQGRRAT
ncbi:MAG: uridine diphosphate-N-acetylglucosamine-binding protein YvcK [Trueperaceae bacterium]